MEEIYSRMQQKEKIINKFESKSEKIKNLVRARIFFLIQNTSNIRKKRINTMIQKRRREQWSNKELRNDKKTNLSKDIMLLKVNARIHHKVL